MRASVLWCCCNKRNGVLSFGGDQIDCNGFGWYVFTGRRQPTSGKYTSGERMSKGWDQGMRLYRAQF